MRTSCQDEIYYVIRRGKNKMGISRIKMDNFNITRKEGPDRFVVVEVLRIELVN